MFHPDLSGLGVQALADALGLETAPVTPDFATAVTQPTARHESSQTGAVSPRLQVVLHERSSASELLRLAPPAACSTAECDAWLIDALLRRVLDGRCSAGQALLAAVMFGERRGRAAIER